MSKEKTTKPDLLFWTDVEANGIVAGRHHIMEISALLTDQDLNPIGEPFYSRVLPLERFSNVEVVDRRKVCIDTLYSEAVPLVQKMHTDNHLWDELRNAAFLSTKQCEAALIEWLRLNSPAGYNLALPSGASIHFDRKMLTAEMPAFMDLLHYRNFDVSSLKRVFEWWLDPAAIPKSEDFQQSIHRAEPDIAWSLVEAQALRDKLAEYDTTLTLTKLYEEQMEELIHSKTPMIFERFEAEEVEK